MSLYRVLNKKITNRSAIITIVGVGYVGLGLLNEFSKKGYKTYGLDINFKKLKGFTFNKRITLTKITKLSKNLILL